MLILVMGIRTETNTLHFHALKVLRTEIRVGRWAPGLVLIPPELRCPKLLV